MAFTYPLDSQQGLFSWFESRPTERRDVEARILANRASLRALPYLRRKGELSSFEHQRLALLIMLTSIRVRVTVTDGLPRFLMVDPTAVEEMLGELTPRIARSAEYALRSSGYSLTSNLSVQEIWNAFQMASSVAGSVRKTDEFLTEILNDIHALEEGVLPESLKYRRLWHSTPSWWAGEYRVFIDLLNSKQWEKKGWPVWLLWYEAVVVGITAFDLIDRNLAEELELRIAIESAAKTQLFGDVIPTKVNAILVDWLEQTRATDTLEYSEKKDFGLSWSVTQHQYQLSVSGDVTDADIAAATETAFEHEKLKTRLAALSLKASAISTRRGWEELELFCTELTEAISVPTGQLYTRILSIYDSSLMLASYLDYNNKLVADPGSNEFRPLQADESRLLQQVVMTVAPWIGRFPTAKRKDEEAGQMFSRMSEEAIFAHVHFVREVEGAGLINSQDRQMMQSLLEALLKFGSAMSVPAEKAQAHGQGTVRKLTFAMALLVSNALGATTAVVAGKLVEDVAAETHTFKATKDFLLSHTLEMERLAQEMPPHLRTAFETVMNQLKREKVPESPPNYPVVDVPKRRKLGPRR